MENKSQATWIAVGVTAIGTVIAYLGYTIYQDNAGNTDNNYLSYKSKEILAEEPTLEETSVRNLNMKPPSFLESFWKSEYKTASEKQIDSD